MLHIMKTGVFFASLFEVSTETLSEFIASEHKHNIEKIDTSEDIQEAIDYILDTHESVMTGVNANLPEAA